MDFALIGAAGFVAPRHMRAIAETGNSLVAALDKNDSVGVIDSHFPDAHFFVEFERFDRHLDKLRRAGKGVDYVAICSPNYLHDSHIRFGLRAGANVICEKPLVLNPWNVDALIEFERDTGKRVSTILQLRLHPAIVALRERVQAAIAADPDRVFDVDLAYVTSRGRWYDVSWKGDVEKSGGLPSNIGVHFYDMLMWVFGAPKENVVHLSEAHRAAGAMVLEHARVRWFLSVDVAHVPEKLRAEGQRTYRSITVDGDELEFSGGFTDLHTRSYEQILAGDGFGLEDARPSIQLVHDIRVSPLSDGLERHPLAVDAG